MISLLPHIFTTLNLFAGFYSIIATLDENYLRAALAILLAIVFDIFDGRIARLTGQSSKFGKEYDSLADMVSFGVAPAILIYYFSLKSFTKMGWLASFLYTACVALRLARFNVKSSSSHYFEGLPSPAGGAIISSFVLLLLHFGIEPLYKNWMILLMVYLISYLLISPIQYPSFKDIKLKKAQSFYFLVLFILMLTLTASNPPLILFIITAFYVLLGPLVVIKRCSSDLCVKVFKKREKVKKIDKIQEDD
ncbi:MAG: CDP-diacylglycerol--serine O-phosphatidyltransferase [Caldimicrobium sp.]|nr:CDP-diacylglycerol--serine O-phosphatidyltransferase [Caldimicrobium sp.]MCX7613395.1 CDP-diacylglycerol--serine O-phosphatidyltransferase [Caldimicrobium sp.]MDW8182375.1 CDP-diacylglycerol--serine O-phosphatidyltransferase [Caldimicrobium sp.]